MFQECLELFQTMFDDLPIVRVAVMLAPLSIFIRTTTRVLFGCLDCSGSSVNIDDLRLEKEVMEVKSPEPTMPPQERENVIITATFPKEVLNDFWKCPYCDGLNENTQIVCVHCAAPRIN